MQNQQEEKYNLSEQLSEAKSDSEWIDIPNTMTHANGQKVRKFNFTLIQE